MLAVQSNLRASEGHHREGSGYGGSLLDLRCQGPSGLAASWVNVKLSPLNRTLFSALPT